MKNNLLTFLVFLCWHPFSQETFSIVENGISIELPISFKKLTQDEVTKKYSSSGVIPNVVFEDENSNISIISTLVSFDKSQYGQYQEAIIKPYIQPNIEILTNEIRKINDKKFIVIKLKMKINNGYEIISTNLTTSIKGKLNTITLTSKQYFADVNSNKFDEIIESISLVENN